MPETINKKVYVSKENLKYVLEKLKQKNADFPFKIKRFQYI